MRLFDPLVPNAHLLTIMGNFWPRPLDTARFPVESRLYQTEPDVQVLMQSQQPNGAAKADMILVHGLEGSGESGYMKSLAQAGLDAGIAMHRFHMRTCGGTERLCQTLYHSGLTSDLLQVVRQFSRPVFLAGFSLGGNVVLKLAGELGAGASALIAGACAVSVPIDLAACSRRIGKIDNRIYERRFLRRMFARLIATGRYTEADLRGIGSIYEIDDRVTAPSFGFGTADNYYATQSSNQFLGRIQVPALVVQAKDDTFIPFEIFQHEAFGRNPHLRLIATDHGGHVGFISRRRPRFWLDQVLVDWVLGQL